MNAAKKRKKQGSSIKAFSNNNAGTLMTRRKQDERSRLRREKYCYFAKNLKEVMFQGNYYIRAEFGKCKIKTH